MGSVVMGSEKREARERRGKEGVRVDEMMETDLVKDKCIYFFFVEDKCIC